jgi:hypothetical protein
MEVVLSELGRLLCRFADDWTRLRSIRSGPRFSGIIRGCLANTRVAASPVTTVTSDGCAKRRSTELRQAVLVAAGADSDKSNEAAKVARVVTGSSRTELDESTIRRRLSNSCPTDTSAMRRQQQRIFRTIATRRIGRIPRRGWRLRNRFGRDQERNHALLAVVLEQERSICCPQDY